MNILRERKGNGWAQIVRQCGALVGYSMDAAPQSVMQSIPKPAVPSEDSIPQIHSAAPRNANARSMASISSEGSTESQTPLMEQEDIAVLTHDVRNFKEALGKLRRTLNREQENQGPQRIMAHEKLGEVLRILRNVLEKYPALQSPELLLSASTLIQHVKGYAFEDTKADPKPFFELIDQLALAFSSRVSEYLMGDLDTNILISNLPCNKNKSCDNLAEDIPEGVVADETVDEKKEDVSQCHLIDEALLNLEQGVEFALNCAKVWSKYVKDILMYVEKRCHLEMEYTRNLNKLALTVRPLINEEVNLPFQSIYCTALDHDIDNSNSSQTTCNLLLGKKFLEPLSERRIEHEKERRQLKEQWFWEVSRMRDVVLHMRQTYGLYIQRQRDAERRPADEDTVQKAVEAEASYKASISDANESHKRLYVVKNDILQRVRTLLAESDSVLRTVTVAYFQLQLTLNNPISIQFQTLCESSRLYEPGSQYVEAIKRLPPPAVASLQTPFTLGKYLDHSKKISDQEHKSNDSIEGEDLLFQDVRVGYMSLHPSHRHSMSKAAVTHSFRKLKTPSRCRECDSYVYFQGVDCSECGLACHKKCLETLAIQCGHKRLPRKMTTFGVDLAHHLGETSTLVPHIVCKCIDEIDARGRLIKGIYRVSGVKSKVEKLCQAFENGADLVDLTDIHPNVIANVLKLYLRQLPEPLLTFRLYPEFVRVAKECPSNSPAEMAAAREDLKELVKKLSKQHYLTLALLMLHLKRVSNDSEVNNMPPSNMGIVFGPTLLRTAEGSASLSSLVDTVHQTRAIELLITHSEEIFNSQEVALAREHSLRMARPASEGGLLGRSFSFMDRSKKNKEYESSLSVAADETDFTHTARNPSDDEISFFLTMDGPGQSKASPQLSRVNPTPKIFKGSLKDYQGLECISLSSLGMKTEDSEHFHQKLKKCVSDSSSRERTTSEISESMSSNRTRIVSKNTRESEKVNVVSRSSEECYDSVFYEKHSHATETSKSMSKNMSSVQRTESCADSDCSFESHASSIDSCSPREMEDSSEVLLELPATWTKKHSPSASSGEIRQKLLCRESPCSSLSRSLDESQGSDKVEDMDVAIRRSMSTLHGTHSRTHIQTSTMIGFQEEENISKAHQSVTSSVGCTARETVHQAHKKAALFEGTNVEMKGKTRQVMMSHEEECGVHLEKVMTDFTKKLHDSTDV